MAEETKKPEDVKPEEAKDTKIKMVKAKLNQAIYLDGKLMDPVKTPVVLMTEEQAKEFCDREFTGKYNWGGERRTVDGDATQAKIRRAVRI